MCESHEHAQQHDRERHDRRSHSFAACLHPMIRLQTSLWQVRRKACAEDVQQMGWDKLLRAVPPQLEHSENMLAELFEVSATQCMRVCSWRLSRHIRMLQVLRCRFL